MKEIYVLDFDNNLFIFPVAEEIQALYTEKQEEWNLTKDALIPKVITGGAREVLNSVFNTHWEEAYNILTKKPSLNPKNLLPLPWAKLGLLPALMQDDSTIIIISNKKSDEITDTLTQYPECRELMKTERCIIVGGDYSGKKKPDLAPFLYAMEQAGINCATQPVNIHCFGDGGLESDTGLGLNIAAYVKAQHADSCCNIITLNYFFTQDGQRMPIRSDSETAILQQQAPLTHITGDDIVTAGHVRNNTDNQQSPT